MKYNVSKEYKSLYHFHAPMGKFILNIGNVFLGLIGPHKRKGLNIKKHFIDINGYKMKAWVFSTCSEKKLPVLFYIHGGGFVIKAAPYHYKLMEDYALGANINVVMIDYRLSPKYRYPIPLNDCLSGYDWMIKKADELNIDTSRIIIGGDSAGGCLAASLCHMIRDEKLTNPIGQMLIYPVLDHRMETRSMKEFPDTPIWNGRLSIKMWDYYLGSFKADGTYASPSTLKNCAGLPKAYIETAEFDCLHDEGIVYYKKLIQNGIESELFETKGTCHGFELCMKAKTTQLSINKRIEFLKDISKK